MARKFYCNMCGKKMEESDLNGGVTIHRYLGYTSRYDGEELTLDICCECLDKLVEKCVITPVDPLVETGYIYNIDGVEECKHSIPSEVGIDKVLATDYVGL